MSKNKKAIYVLFLFLFVGCGTAPKGIGPIFKYSPPNESTSYVYHYRLNKVAGNGLYYYLFMNGELVTLIGNGGYFTQNLLPGEYKYAVKDQVTALPGMPITYLTSEIDNKKAKIKHVLDLVAKPNKSYYFRWNYGFGKVEQIEENIALKELEGLKRFELKK